MTSNWRWAAPCATGSAGNCRPDLTFAGTGGEKTGGSAIPNVGERIAMPRARTTHSHRPDTAVSRRSVVAGSVGIAALPAATPLDSAAVDAAEDERFMRIAI